MIIDNVNYTRGIIKHINTVQTIPPSCSIFTAEAMAIIKAIEIITQEEHSKFIILSDSL